MKVCELEGLPIRTLFVECASPVAAVRVTVNAGAEADGEGQHGLAHLVEHLACADTTRLSSADVRRSRAIIGDWNAWTNYDRTVYWQEFLHADAREATRLVLEGVFKAANKPEEFEKQRSIIVQEIKDRADDPWSSYWDKFYGFLYGDRYEDAAGDPQTFPAMPYGSIFKFRTEFYHPDNATLVVAGPYSPEFIEEVKRGIIEGVDDGVRSRGQCAMDKPSFRVGRFTYGSKSQSCRVGVFSRGIVMSQAAFCQFETDLLGSIIGGGLHGLIVERLREQLGIVYEANSFHQEHRGFGFFRTAASCSWENSERVENEINLLLDRLSCYPTRIDFADLQRAAEAAVGLESFRNAKALNSASWLTGLAAYWPDVDVDDVARNFDFMRQGSWRTKPIGTVVARACELASTYLQKNRSTVVTVQS